jgi:acetylornithine/N-succinyldiaminopimelate aminotransferase
MTSAVMPTYARAPVTFAKGEGCRLIDTEGRRYLDFGAGIAVCGLGHAHPKLIEALTRQANTLWHTSNLYRVEGQEMVAAKLAALSFGDVVFFANSGAEANECSIKLARRYQASRGNPEKWRILAFEGSFHGRTLATLAAAGSPRNLAGFGPVVTGFDHAPYGDLDKAAALVGPDTAAILVEPIQGEGGIRVPPPDFLKGLRALADKHGALLMFDEVQCGLARSGRLFAHERFGVVPDVMSLAKTLGGGFPVAACVATAKAASGMTAGSHASTFGGNLLAMAVASTVLDIIAEPAFLASVARKGEKLAAGLDALVKRHPNVFEQRRGVGLMQGLRCSASQDEIVDRLRDAALIVVPAQDKIIRLIPPLIVDEQEIDEALSILESVARAMPAKAA